MATLAIERNPIPGAEYRAWIGHVDYDASKLTRSQKRHVAIAGLIAEQIGDHKHPTDCNHQELVQFLKDSWTENWNASSIWSEQDWEDARGWTELDVRSVLETLVDKWDDLNREAEFHIKWTPT
jgi:hypothetical protein